ncbi:MAG: hypothetical protein U0271_04890 [Polyangiaceae bacterium]
MPFAKQPLFLPWSTGRTRDRRSCEESAAPPNSGVPRVCRSPEALHPYHPPEATP